VTGRKFISTTRGGPIERRSSWSGWKPAFTASMLVRAIHPAPCTTSAFTRKQNAAWQAHCALKGGCSTRSVAHPNTAKAFLRVRTRVGQIEQRREPRSATGFEGKYVSCRSRRRAAEAGERWRRQLVGSAGLDRLKRQRPAVEPAQNAPEGWGPGTRATLRSIAPRVASSRSVRAVALA
jgi:hypothetical protein